MITGRQVRGVGLPVPPAQSLRLRVRLPRALRQELPHGRGLPGRAGLRLREEGVPRPADLQPRHGLQVSQKWRSRSIFYLFFTSVIRGGQECVPLQYFKWKSKRCLTMPPKCTGDADCNEDVHVCREFFRNGHHHIHDVGSQKFFRSSTTFPHYVITRPAFFYLRCVFNPFKKILCKKIGRVLTYFWQEL